MRTLVALAALTSLVALPACTSEASSAAGTYTVTFDTAGMPEAMATMLKSAKPGDLTLGADGKWEESTEMEDPMGKKVTSTISGTWKMEGGDIVMTATHQDGKKMEKPVVSRGAYKEGAFSIEYEKGGVKMKMDMKKK